MLVWHILVGVRGGRVPFGRCRRTPSTCAEDAIRRSSMNLYIGNLSHQATEADVQQAFEAFGQVTSATIIKDRASGASRGFAFVEMPAKDEAEAAMAALS